MAGEPGKADCKCVACQVLGHCCKAAPAPASLLTLNSWLVDLVPSECSAVRIIGTEVGSRSEDTLNPPQTQAHGNYLAIPYVGIAESISR